MQFRTAAGQLTQWGFPVSARQADAAVWLFVRGLDAAIWDAQCEPNPYTGACGEFVAAHNAAFVADLDAGG